MLPPQRRDETPESVVCCRGAVVLGFHVVHVCFSDDKLLGVAVDACDVWAKHSGLDVRMCENQCVRLQLLRALYWPSTRDLMSDSVKINVFGCSFCVRCVGQAIS